MAKQNNERNTPETTLPDATPTGTVIRDAVDTIAEKTEQKQNPEQKPSLFEQKPQDSEQRTIAEWAMAFRLPSWQIAALNRLMAWEDGKCVSRESYQDGLDRLRNRRLGG